MRHARTGGGAALAALAGLGLIGLGLALAARPRGAARIAPPRPDTPAADEAGDAEAVHAAGLRAKLARCRPEVGAMFERFDAQIDSARPTRAHGRDGRYYRIGRRRLSAIDPKVEHLRIWVGARAYAAAPPALRDAAYEQDDWLVVRPAYEALAQGYLDQVWRDRLAELSR